jgi:hypothetical protein
MGSAIVMTAREFAQQASIWHRVTPTLEQFTRWANRNVRPYSQPVLRSAAPRKEAALVAELAFEMASSGGSPFDHQPATAEFVSRLAGGAPVDLIGKSNVQETFQLRDNIAAFLDLVPEEALFRPRLPGCGVVDEAEVDIVCGRRLIEVKSVQRTFRGTDFRQVLTYATLGYATGQEFDTISLVNPRLGCDFTLAASDLALDIGAGSWVQLMQDLVDAMVDTGVSQ